MDTTGLGLAAGGLCTIAALASLFHAWRLRRAMAALGGAALLLLAGAAWRAALGTEFGVCVAVLAPAIAAWLIVATQRSRRTRSRTARAGPGPARRTPAEHAVLLLNVVPLAGALALATSAALARRLPWPEVDALVFAVLLLPITWGCAAFWAASHTPLRAVPWLLAITGGALLVAL